MTLLERIICGVEYRWRVQQAKSYGVFWILVSVVIMFFMLARGASSDFWLWLLAGVIMTLAFGCLFGFMALLSLRHNKKLLKNYERFEQYKVLLDTPVVSKTYRRFSYFILRFEDENGKEIICQTNPIWGFGDTDLFPLQEYRDQYVDILYDAARSKVYVIGLSEEEEE